MGLCLFIPEKALSLNVQIDIIMVKCCVQMSLVNIPVLATDYTAWRAPGT